LEEDTDEKIRRNLIVASTAVLLGAWLNLPALAIVKRVLGEDAGSSVQPWRLWAAVIALLLYLSLRYRFSDGVRHAWDTNRAEFQSFRIAAMDAMLVSEAKRYTKTGAESSAFYSELNSYVASRGGTRKTRPEIALNKITHHTPGKGEAELSLSWSAEHVSDSSDRPIGFELSKQDSRIANARALVRLLAYSRSSTSMLVPSTMAALALGISTWRLLQQFACP